MKTPEEIFNNQTVDRKFKEALAEGNVECIGNLKNGYYGGKVYKWLTQKNSTRKFVVIHGKSEKFYNNIEYFSSKKFAVQSLIQDIERNTPKVNFRETIRMEGDLKWQRTKLLIF